MKLHKFIVAIANLTPYIFTEIYYPKPDFSFNNSKLLHLWGFIHIIEVNPFENGHIPLCISKDIESSLQLSINDMKWGISVPFSPAENNLKLCAIKLV